MAALEHGTDSIRLVGVAGHAQPPREAEQIVEFDADDAVVEIVGNLPSSPSMKRQIKTADAPVSCTTLRPSRGGAVRDNEKYIKA